MVQLHLAMDGLALAFDAATANQSVELFRNNPTSDK